MFFTCAVAPILLGSCDRLAHTNANKILDLQSEYKHKPEGPLVLCKFL
jgi:hypothetical protein